MTTYECGCVNQVHPATGAMLCVHKCSCHLQKNQEECNNGEAYYRKLGALDPDATDRYIAELEEALGQFPTGQKINKVALEIGGGASPYINLLYEAGYVYNAIDTSDWACQWTRERLRGIPSFVINKTLERAILEDGLSPSSIDLIICAHALEHMPNAPQSLVQIFQLLKPGGLLYLIIPDDSDPINPGHLWFFNETTLLNAMDQAGFIVDILQSRQIVPHEKFIYVKARKSDAV